MIQSVGRFLCDGLLSNVRRADCRAWLCVCVWRHNEVSCQCLRHWVTSVRHRDLANMTRLEWLWCTTLPFTTGLTSSPSLYNLDKTSMFARLALFLLPVGLVCVVFCASLCRSVVICWSSVPQRSFCWRAWLAKYRVKSAYCSDAVAGQLLSYPVIYKSSYFRTLTEEAGEIHWFRYQRKTQPSPITHRPVVRDCWRTKDDDESQWRMAKFETHRARNTYTFNPPSPKFA